MHFIFPSCFSVDYYQVVFLFFISYSHLYENSDRNESNILAVLEKENVKSIIPLQDL